MPVANLAIHPSSTVTHSGSPFRDKSTAFVQDEATIVERAHEFDVEPFELPSAIWALRGASGVSGTGGANGAVMPDGQNGPDPVALQTAINGVAAILSSNATQPGLYALPSARVDSSLASASGGLAGKLGGGRCTHVRGDTGSGNDLSGDVGSNASMDVPAADVTSSDAADANDGMVGIEASPDDLGIAGSMDDPGADVLGTNSIEESTDLSGDTSGVGTPLKETASEDGGRDGRQRLARRHPMQPVCPQPCSQPTRQSHNTATRSPVPPAACHWRWSGPDLGEGARQDVDQYPEWRWHARLRSDADRAGTLALRYRADPVC